MLIVRNDDSKCRGNKNHAVPLYLIVVLRWRLEPLVSSTVLATQIFFNINYGGVNFSTKNIILGSQVLKIIDKDDTLLIS